MSNLHVGSLQRSISAMGFGLQQEVQRKVGETARSKLTEIEQQFQIEVNGDADSRLVWATEKLQFQEILYYAPTQRVGNRLDTPHVYFGCEMKSGPLTLISGCVKEWEGDRGSGYSGAVIGIAAQGNGKFRGVLHVTVQGFGAPLDHDNGQSDA